MADKIEDMIHLPDIIEIEQVTDFRTSYYLGISDVYKITYLSDGLKVHGFVGAPKDYLEKDYPIIIYNRGAAEDEQLILPYYIATLSDPGYVVLASQYRGCDGGEGRDELGGDDVNDVIKLIDIGEQLSFADTENIFMIGASRGGMMTYLACRQDERITAAVSSAGVSDAAFQYYSRGSSTEDFGRLIGGSPEELPEEYEARSAVFWADEIKAPLLILHGELDSLVDISQSERLVAELEKAGKEVKFITYPDEFHNLSYGAWFYPSMEWFEQHMK